MERLLLTSLGSSPYSAMVKLNKKRAYFQLTNNSCACWLQKYIYIISTSSIKKYKFTALGNMVLYQFICKFICSLYRSASIRPSNQSVEQYRFLQKTYGMSKVFSTVNIPWWRCEACFLKCEHSSSTLKFLIQWLPMSRFL